MAYKLKALGAASMAVLASVAVATPAAQGQAAFTVGFTITGSQLEGGQHDFTSSHGVVDCNVVTFHGATAGTEATDLRLTPNYENCLFAGLSTTIDMTGCAFTFVAEDTVAESADAITARLQIECPPGKKIDINPAGSECELTINPQTVESGITLHNSGEMSAMDIRVTTDITSALAYTVHNPTKCPNKSDITERTNGSYTGETTLTGHFGAEAINITVH